MLYFDGKGSDFNFEASSENIIEGYFMSMPQLPIGNKDRPSISGLKRYHPEDHSAANYSTKSTLSCDQVRTPPGPGRFEVSKADMRRSLDAILCRHRHYSLVSPREQP